MVLFSRPIFFKPKSLSLSSPQKLRLCQPSSPHAAVALLTLPTSRASVSSHRVHCPSAFTFQSPLSLNLVTGRGDVEGSAMTQSGTRRNGGWLGFRRGRSGAKYLKHTPLLAKILDALVTRNNVEDKVSITNRTDKVNGEESGEPVVKDDLFEENFKEPRKWADVKSSKYRTLSVIRERRSGRVLNDVIQDDGDPPKKKLYDLKLSQSRAKFDSTWCEAHFRVML
ncbi:hypothetical protein Droror1_Dr00023103 [Drosera rotundifolia]